MLTPKYIFAQDFAPMEAFFRQSPHREVSFRRGDQLWELGEPLARIHYFKSGIAMHSCMHESGHQKVLSFHAAGTVYPVFHYQEGFQIEDTLTTVALTHIQALEFTREEFQRMFEASAALRRHVLDWYASYVNLLIYDSAHQEFNSTRVRVANLLYLLLVREGSRALGHADLTQEMLAETLGTSLASVTRSLAALREDGIIATHRQSIEIKDSQRLMAICSGETVSPCG